MHYPEVNISCTIQSFQVLFSFWMYCSFFANEFIRMGMKKLLILIVDDNMNFVKRIIGLLEDLNNIGYINVANDYEQAIKFLEEEKPDLALLDINLPGKSGIEILRKIKETNNECEVVMVSNHADEYYRNLCSELGAKYFLDKSNEFAMVPEIIEHMEFK